MASPRIACLAATIVLAGADRLAHACPAEGAGFELADVLDVEVTRDEVLAMDGLGGTAAERLWGRERVLHSEAHGCVGIVLTDRRALAISAAAGDWREVQLEVGESASGQVLLGDRVALVLTDERVLGFDGTTGNWLQRDLLRHEEHVESRAGDSVAVVVTDRRVLALSADRGGLFTADLRLDESLERVRVRSTLATVTTSRRVLVFHGQRGLWSFRSTR